MFDYSSPFALVCQGEDIKLYEGDITHYQTIDQLPSQAVVMIPFSQVHEKGYDYVGIKHPLIALIPEKMTKHKKTSLLQKYLGQQSTFRLKAPDDEVLSSITDTISSNFSDTDYTDVVDNVTKQEIKAGGEGPNFVISRQFKTQIIDFSSDCVTKIFLDLLRSEENAHMIFLFFDGERYFVGATPEAHLRVKHGRAMMNPISGTLPKRTISKFDKFLQDKKEINELFQVTDEEIKMMSRMCSKGGAVQGPFLKEMNSVIHTEYYLEGDLSMPLNEAIRTSLFAATLVGSPVKNACRIIKKYEPTSRRYYGGCIGVIDGEDFDSGILIRTAEINATGEVTLQVGASLVEYSDPAKECQETHAKVGGFLKVLQGQTSTFTPSMPEFDKSLLYARNKDLSRFLLEPQVSQVSKNKKVYLLHNGDDFLYTIGHMCETMGYDSKYILMKSFSSIPSDADLIIVGPGPGDPRKMKTEQDIVYMIQKSGLPYIGVCLGHQLVAATRGYQLKQKHHITQGSVQQITIDDKEYLMGYYNSFAVYHSSSSSRNIQEIQNKYGEIDILRGENRESMQFHPESIFSKDGYAYLQHVVTRLL